MHTNKLTLFFLLSIAMHLGLIASNNNDSDNENERVVCEALAEISKLTQPELNAQSTNQANLDDDILDALSYFFDDYNQNDDINALNSYDFNAMNPSSSSSSSSSSAVAVAVAPDVLPVSINALKELSKEDILKYCKNELNSGQTHNHEQKNRRAYQLYKNLISANRESDIPNEIIQFSHSYQHKKQQNKLHDQRRTQGLTKADIESAGCAKWLEEYYQIKPNFDLENCSLQDFCPATLRDAYLKFKSQGIDTLSSQERSDADFYEKFYRSTSNLSWVESEQNNDLTNQRKVAYKKQQSIKSLPLEERLLAEQHVPLKERLLAEQHAYRKAEISLYNKKRRLDSSNSTNISQNN